jgi:DNA-binding transcriptional ArsR family regulator
MTTDVLDRTFAALADPTRRAILERLARGEATVGELAAPFAISQPAVSKHLRVLKEAGLISQFREAQRRPCRLEPEQLDAVTDWVEEYRRIWDDRLDRLGDYLQDLQGKGNDDDE